MSSFQRSQTKHLFRTGIISPPKDIRLFQIGQPLQNIRQKALSFKYELTTADHPIAKNPIHYPSKAKTKQSANLQVIFIKENECEDKNASEICFKQKKYNSAYRFLANSPKIQNHQLKNEIYNHKRTSTENNFNDHYLRDRNLHFQSLRSNLTNNQNFFEACNSIPLCLQTNQKKKITLTKNPNENEPFQKKQNNLLSPSHLEKRIPFSVNSSFQKKCNFNQQTTHRFCDIPNHKKIPNLQQMKQNVLSFFPLKDRDQKTKRQRKFPSFLISRVQRKQNQEKIESRHFKIAPKDQNKQIQEEAVKIPQIKKLLKTKHVKSFSVFENLCSGDNRKFIQPRQTIIDNQDQSHQSKGDHIKARKRTNSIQQNQKTFNETPNLQAKNHYKAQQSNSMPKQLLAFRQSLDKFHSNYKPIEHKQQMRKTQQSKTIVNQTKKVTFDKKFAKNSQDIIFQRLQTQASLKKQNLILPDTKKLQAMNDIKRTLINCNIFSEEGYKDVFDNHKKDLLKNCQNNFATQNQKTQRQKARFKPSIKNLIDTSGLQQDLSSNRSIQQELKIAELTSICQQKRSKWILEQTDTIKQSLKQLSEFNTQKSLRQNECKKISMKDFIPSRSNRASVQIQDIYELRQQESILDSKNLKFSSVEYFSESSEGKCDEDRLEPIKKISSFEGQTQSQVQRGLSNACLQDFTIRWVSEQQFLDRTSQNEISYVLCKAQHRITKTLYTIKKYEKNVIRNLGESFMSNFIKNVRIQIKMLNHPNVQKIYTVFNDENSIYILCEFTDAKLSNVLAQNKRKSIISSSEQSICLHTLSNEYQRAEIFRQIIDGLEQIHLHHIVHKNFQPNSIRMIWNSCKISSFDLCELQTKPINPKFSNSYLCPQNLFDNTKTSMDIWCLGILAYQILIGKKPFQSCDKSNSTVKKILQCNFEIPSEKASLCQQVLRMALKRNPKDRASIFDIKNSWAIKLNNYSTIQLQHKEIHKKLLFALQN